ncbi:ribbon-helix-helix domain-containing protein [Methyloraptor flagellatus]|jgi:predicted DNA-binding ribbon-helix-helix protein|uniref:Ribbon-helix-helix domain-containing protein n=1 Tax=Methyloraptor flagellatus TaxID=3162530 RepID=A0AAU7XAV7_9HYPH
MLKRSVTIAGHRTSIALEPEFWAALDDQAARRALPLAALIAEIDVARGTANLASALRLAVLADFRARLEAATALTPDTGATTVIA